MDGTGGGGHEQPIGEHEAERRLLDALWRGEAHAAAVDLCALDPAALSAGARDLAAAVVAAGDGMRAVGREAAAEALGALAAAGVPARTTETPDVGQVAAFALDVPVRAARRAIEVLGHHGYRGWHGRSPGALVADLRVRGGVALARDAPGHPGGPHAVRLVLRTRPGRVAVPPRVAALVTPTDRDLRAVALPARGWPTYLGLAALRRLARAVERPVERPAVAAPAPVRAPFLGTPVELVPPMLALAGVGADDVLVDLGCGDGRVVVAAARAVGCRGVGIDDDPALVEVARAHAVGADVRILHGDAAALHLGPATAVFVFLPPDALGALLPDVLAGLPPGGVVVAHEQRRLDPPVEPDTTRLVVGGCSITAVSIWRVPPRAVAGAVG